MGILGNCNIFESVLFAGTANGFVTDATDVQIINRLEHRIFGELMYRRQNDGKTVIWT